MKAQQDNTRKDFVFTFAEGLLLPNYSIERQSSIHHSLFTLDVQFDTGLGVDLRRETTA